MSILAYYYISDRVAETCVDCDLRRLLREPFCILQEGINMEQGVLQDKPFMT